MVYIPSDEECLTSTISRHVHVASRGAWPLSRHLYFFQAASSVNRRINYWLPISWTRLSSLAAFKDAHTTNCLLLGLHMGACNRSFVSPHLIRMRQGKCRVKMKDAAPRNVRGQPVHSLRRRGGWTCAFGSAKQSEKFICQGHVVMHLSVRI